MDREMEHGNGLAGLSTLSPSIPGRIAFLLPSLLPFGGTESMRAAMMPALIDRGYEVDLVLANEPKHTNGWIDKRIRVFNLGVPALRATVRPFMDYLSTEKPAAVVADLWPLTFYAPLAGRLSRTKTFVAVCEHNMLSLQYGIRGRLHAQALRWSLHWGHRWADARIAVSMGVADDLSALSGMSRNDYHVIHNPMPLGHASAAETEVAEAAWRGWTGTRILSVGRLKPQKNHFLLIKAFRRLLASQDARLMILGEGELAEETRRFACAEGVDDKVFLPGHVENPVAFYGSAHLFALSSDYEGFGNVIVEALASGLPVVSTDCPSGPAEILEGGRYGRLVPVGDDVALARAMREALADQHDRQALIRRSRDFSLEVAVGKYLKALFPAGADLLQHDSLGAART